ncbi:MAG: NADH:flavin oxidoreductase, partial [Cytophagales bacterium]|nr:NADH:flavin oxidoreductase [Cytophagales bacterium]
MSTKSKPKYTRIAQLKTAEQFKEHINSLGISMPFSESVASGENSAFAKKIELKSGSTIGNS